MKIVLIRPPNSRGEVSILSHTVPVNLGCLASYLMKNGYEVEIWDYETEQFIIDEFINKIKISSPSIIGFSCFTPTIISGHKLAQIIKKNFPHIKTIVGGPHSTALPKKTLEEFPYFDFVIMGEGEETLLEFCNSIKENKDQEGILGLAYRTSNGIKEELRRPLIKNLDDLPFPNRDLLNINLMKKGHISRGISNKLKNTGIYTSRGCPIGCIFCAISITMGNCVRFRSVENVLLEVEECIKKYQIEHFTVEDDTFTINQERAIKIMEGFQKLGVKSWHCEGTRVNAVTPELLKLMVKTGCQKIVFGVESGSPRILELIKKKITVEQVKNAFKWAREAGFKYIEGDFIIGSHPSETIKDLETTKDLIKEIKPDLISVTILVPYPGTEVYNLMKERGYIFSENWENFVMFDRLPSWRTEFFTPDELLRLQKKILSSFYLRVSYFIHILKKLKSLEELKYWSEIGVDFIKWLFQGRLT